MKRFILGGFLGLMMACGGQTSDQDSETGAQLEESGEAEGALTCTTVRKTCAGRTSRYQTVCDGNVALAVRECQRAFPSCRCFKGAPLMP